MRFVIIISFVFIFADCGSDDRSPKEVETIIGDTVLAWETNADSMIMVRDRTIPDSAITVERILNGLNQKYPEVPIIYIKQRNDTLFTKVTNGEYLGNQMGSAGAAAWYDDATINLTSVAGINYVAFDVGMYSHAGSTVIGKNKYQGWERQ